LVPFFSSLSNLLEVPQRSHPSFRGRLRLRFERAVWICSTPSAAITCVFDVQQNVRPITLNAANIAASRAARRCAARTRHHAACSTACVFEYSDQKIGWKEKMTSKTHAALHAARRAAGHAARCRVSEIGLEFCCTSKTHVIAADGSLHIQTAHRKRKCNRPLNTNNQYFHKVHIILIMSKSSVFTILHSSQN
jgi:exonuclease VII large subunit